jgi:AraC-like DNA-binding protein
MPLLRYRPSAPICQFVECFWWSERFEPQTYCEHILPSGRAQLVFALHDDPIIYRASGSSDWEAWTGSVVHGPQRRHYIAGPKPCGAVMGVSFRPGCAGAVLGIPMPELADQHVSLGALWGKQAEELRERLRAAIDPTVAFRILEKHLNGRIQAPLLVHPAVARALASSGLSPRISALQREAGCSPRHFIALFNSSVGVTPKHYYRIQRFNIVTQRLAFNANIILADLAVSVGYSDQAHLTREFHEFAGVPPTRYRGNSGSPLHHQLARTVSAAETR